MPPHAPKHHSLIHGRRTHARGLVEEEVDHFLEEYPTIIPLFEIDVISAIGSSPAEDVTEDSLAQDEPDPTTIAELRHARDTFERELAIS